MNSNAPAGRPANAPSPRRLLVTVAIFSIVAGIVAIVVMGQRGQGTAAEQAPQAATPSATTSPAPGSEPAAAPQAADAAAPAAPAATAPPAAPTAPWVARSPGSPSTVATPLGSLDPATGKFLLELTPRGAGITRVVFSDLWKSGTDRMRAIEARAAGAAEDTLEGRYEIAAPGTLQGFTLPILGARAIEIDGREVPVVGQVWTETAPGTFVTEIADSTGALQMRATRRWSIEPGSWEIRCEQRVENLSASPHSVRWVQFGPSDLPRDPTDLVDARRYHSGYLMSKERDPAQSTVIVHGATLDQSTVVGRVDSGDWRVWPDARQQEERYNLSWFGATNRYFALAIHAPYSPPGSPSKAIAPAAALVQAQVGEGTFHGKPDRVVFTDLTSDAVTIQAGQSAGFDVGVYAGPLERSVLGSAQPFASLNMQGLILYLMSGCCSWCTFAWLADILVSFLAFLHDWVVFDWGLAIVVLVVVVRGLLHPLTRRAQVSMMRVSKQMGSLKPEIDALQKRYKDEPKRLQEETLRLYREKGINPLGCAGGMLPTFLQMPIWLALYAVLYFAFELRQQPAFFGVFQQLGGWQFLGDLSAQDRFIPLPFEVNVWVTTLSSVNIVPILMGIVFYFQQKYMTPPPAPNATPEQLQQQAMMKWMMVILFPIMLYAAPSGLTIYIATSTLVGIYESKRIRKSMEGVDFSKAPARKPGGFLQRAYENAMKRAQEAQRGAEARRSAPSRKFRDR